MDLDIVKKAYTGVGKLLGGVNPIPYILQGVIPIVADNAVGDGTFDSVKGKYLGTNMTGQERQNAELNFQNQLRMMREGPQAQVEGAERAGINPVFALTGQSHTPSAGNTSSISSGGSLSDLVALATLPAQLKLLNKQADKTSAEEDKIRSETTGQDISNEFARRLNEAEAQSRENAIQLTKAEIQQVYQRIEESKADVVKKFKEVDSIQSEMDLRASQILLNNASAYRIRSLIPFERAEMSARSEAERAAAQASLAHAAYENGLIDNGYIQAMCKSMNAEASIKDVEAFYRDPTHKPSAGIEHVVRSIESAVFNLVKFISPMK